MPRDVNGNYTLPAGNPVVSGTIIESVWANTTMSDLATEMTDSLSRSGKGGFTGPVGVIDGTSGGIPGLNFINEPTSGLLRDAAGDWRLAAQSIDKLRIRSGDLNLCQIWTGAPNGWEDIATKQRIGLPLTGEVAMAGTHNVTKLWFYNNAVQVGWVLEPLDGTNIRSLMAVPAAASGGAVGGSLDPEDYTFTDTISITIDFPASTSGHALTKEEIEHNHPPAGPNVSQPGGVGKVDGTSAVINVTAVAHSHLLGGSNSDTYALSLPYTPRYARGFIATCTNVHA